MTMCASRYMGRWRGPTAARLFQTAEGFGDDFIHSMAESGFLVMHVEMFYKQW